MAYTYAYKPKVKSRSEVGSSRDVLREERQGLLATGGNGDDWQATRASLVRPVVQAGRQGGYGAVAAGNGGPRSEAPSFRSKAKTLLSAGDGMTADLTFENVSVISVPKNGSRDDTRNLTQLLNNVSGTVRAGEVMAVMGASGAGKSTLMNVLTNRNLSDNLMIDGIVKVNGTELGSAISKISGYVQQDDVFFPTLSVREHMEFQAALRIGRLLTKQERYQRIDELLNLMGLTKCQHTRIGLPGIEKSISGGESKRLAFATELIVNPAILFCDEPTTGLDSFMAEQVVNVLRQLAKRGKTIICVIHQPASHVFNMFSRLLLLAEGRVAYHGSCDGALRFFESLNFPCPESYNAAEHYIKTLAIAGGHVAECKEKVNAICDAFERSPDAAEVRKSIDVATGHEQDLRSVMLFDQTPSYRVSALVQLRWLVWRAMLDNMRNPDMFRVRTIQKIVVAVIYGMVYLHGVKPTQEGIQNINGALFLYMTENSFAPMLDLVAVFQRGIALFKREYAAYMYRLSIYYLAQVLGWLPSFAIDASVFCVITYFMVGLVPEWYKFLITFVICIITANVAAASGSLVSTISPSIDVGLVIAPTLTVIVMLFGGGVYLKLKTLPPYLAWLQWLSWFRYGNEILGIVHWQGVTNITCSADPQLPCITTGAEVMADNQYDPAKLGFDFGMLAALYAGFHLCAYFVLYTKNRKRN
ncbi:Protein scarlet [Hypsibius exemplaris]|uniref:Protein scarlet n=1 Tax=Hypsibius exemplaris TaxID=2072580 RepID=A0A9X6NQL2_HYPEX|nr:Protein scarlet [Hypsibius exemplaris]